jgi:hypothetical protein
MIKIMFSFTNGGACLPLVKTTKNHVVLSLPRDVWYFPHDLETWGCRYSELFQVLYVNKDKVDGALYNNQSGELIRDMLVASDECPQTHL